MNPSNSAPPSSLAVTDAASLPGSVLPRLGLGPIGIVVRSACAVAMLMLGNLATGLVVQIVSIVPGGAAFLAAESFPAILVFIAAQAAALAVVLGALALWMRFIERGRLRDIGWRWGPRSAGALMVSVAISGGIVVGIVALLTRLGVSTSPAVSLDGVESPLLVVGLVLFMLSQSFLLQGIPEELLFRGWLLTTLRARPALAIIVSTAVFTIIHLISGGGQQNAAEHVVYLAVPFGFSLLAVGLLLLTGSLWAAIGVHGGFHLGTFAAGIWVAEPEGPGFWLSVGGAHALVGAVLIVIALRRGRRIP